MRAQTKVILFFLLSLAILIVAFLYSDIEEESCEASGGIYAMRPLSWSYECIPDPTKIKP